MNILDCSKRFFVLWVFYRINAQRFLFYIILSNYVRSMLFCWDKHRDISQTWFHVCMKVHWCETQEQPNIMLCHYVYIYYVINILCVYMKRMWRIHKNFSWYVSKHLRVSLYMRKRKIFLFFYLEVVYNQLSLKIISKLFWRGTITWIINDNVFLACGSDLSCHVIE